MRAHVRGDEALSPRTALVLLGLSLFVLAMVGQFRVPVLPDIGRDLRMGPTDLGLLTTVFAAARLVTNLPAGALVDRLGVRRALVLVALTSATGSLLFAVAQHRWHALGAALVLGVASSTGNLTGMSFFARRAPDHRRGAAMASYSVAIRGGGTMGPMVSAGLATFGGWRTAMLVGSVTSALLTLAAMVPVRPASREHATPRSAATATGGETEASREARPDTSGYSTSQRLVLGLVPFSTLAAQGALPLTLIPIIGVDSLGLTTAFVGLTLGLGGGLRILSTFVGGWAADHVGRKPALVPGLVIQALGVGMLGLEGRTWAWVLSVLVFSAGAVGTSVAAAMLADQAPPGRMGRHISHLRLMGDSGFLVGPLVTVAIFERAGQRAAALAVAGLLAASALAVGTGLPETRPRARER